MRAGMNYSPTATKPYASGASESKLGGIILREKLGGSEPALCSNSLLREGLAENRRCRLDSPGARGWLSQESLPDRRGRRSGARDERTSRGGKRTSREKVRTNPVSNQNQAFSQCVLSLGRLIPGVDSDGAGGEGHLPRFHLPRFKRSDEFPAAVRELASSAPGRPRLGPRTAPAPWVAYNERYPGRGGSPCLPRL